MNTLKVALALALLPLFTGCSPKDASTDTSSPSGAPSPSGATSDANTIVPRTTTINGKEVPLKLMPNGLKYYDTVVGTGPSPRTGQTASMRYIGTLLDGTKFDSSYDRRFGTVQLPAWCGSGHRGVG